ncbi:MULTISPECIES: efflux RND transporter periplasmic adaptor subunit [Methylophaga]|jgi:membrane fusion protein, copper/silver efflux system|uniref:Membrane-fusion protein n=1 Tax=Methylophaga aminisulfidivorans MP TaxID=1026882 RepID=F5T104_9GAMM|nr:MULTISPECIES: efflux RND transporter periplasmic adaptor subunit [Methylophaga]EGL53900.1 membrane-fusion protein [Methylophaga aminisulfidivorans MP]WVI83666.1 efflux RND transporter periplasmic adaptor subunit [Methylophaga thalassica]
MTSSYKTLLLMLFAILLTAVITYSVTRVYFENNTVSNSEAEQKQPLYWVAPMDPNYRRDKAGKSPMGMDLIPVYEENETSQNSGPGTITISPDVVNNIGVRIVKAEYGPIHSEINTVGYVQYDEDKLVHIHPRVEGWVDKLYVKAAGDPIKKGQPLYKLYSPELVNAQEELVLALNRNNVRLIKAAEDRLKALQIANSVINQIKQTRKVQQAITFYAPQSGVIDNLNVREGFYVKPGMNLMSVGDLSTVWVEAEIFERQAELVKAGQAVTMTLDYMPGTKWIGKVDYVYPTLNDETRTVRVRLRFDNEDYALKPNMFAQVTIATGEEKEKLMIPMEALIRTGDQDRVVLALGEGQFKSITVIAGNIGESHVEIINGLEPGEEVVSSAQFLLDSESSKTSDFKRMHHEDSKPRSVWVEAKIESVMTEHHMITAAHSAISEWDWPAMTMDFSVSENIDLSTLSKGTQLHMEITNSDTEYYEITGIHIKESGTSTVNEESATEGDVKLQSIDDESMNHNKHQEKNTQMDSSESSEHSHHQHSGM